MRDGRDGVAGTKLNENVRFSTFVQGTTQLLVCTDCTVDSTVDLDSTCRSRSLDLDQLCRSSQMCRYRYTRAVDLRAEHRPVYHRLSLDLDLDLARSRSASLPVDLDACMVDAVRTVERERARSCTQAHCANQHGMHRSTPRACKSHACSFEWANSCSGVLYYKIM